MAVTGYSLIFVLRHYSSAEFRLRQVNRRIDYLAARPPHVPKGLASRAGPTRTTTHYRSYILWRVCGGNVFLRSHSPRYFCVPFARIALSQLNLENGCSQTMHGARMIKVNQKYYAWQHQIRRKGGKSWFLFDDVRWRHTYSQSQVLKTVCYSCEEGAAFTWRVLI